MDSSGDVYITPEHVYCHDLILSVAHLLTALDYSVELIDAFVEQHEMTEDAAAKLAERIQGAIFEAEAMRFEAYNMIGTRWPHVIGELMTPKIEWLSPMDLLMSMLAPYRRRAEVRGVDISISAVTPAGEGLPRMWLETFAIRRAFHNVLSNAVKYSYASGDGRSRYIRVWCSKVDPKLRTWGIFVQNYGVGIESDEGGLIFVPGYRGRLARKEGSRGCGLGLAEARRCIEAHGGSLRVDSRPQSGPDQKQSAADTASQPIVYLTTVRMIFPEHTRFPSDGNSQ